MATVVPSASCLAYGQPLQLFGKGPRSAYLSLFAYRGPRCPPRPRPRPRLTHHAPKLTLRQIYRMLKMMKQVRQRETAAASRKQASAAPALPSPGTKPEKKPCSSCLRHKRSVKRVC